MKPMYFSVDVLMERIPLANRWVSEQWRPAAVVAIGETGEGVSIGEPAGAELVADGPAGTTWRFPARVIELHPSEAQGYYLNITSETPIVFVMWRPAEDGSEPAARPEVVTVSYDQAGRLMDGGEKVEPVPMPAEILAWIRPFVAEHYKPEPRRKMKRNDPFSDGAYQRDRTPRG
jgi:hypothetical protein